MKKLKQHYRVVLTLGLSIIIFTILTAISFMSGDNMLYVRAGGMEPDDCTTGEIAENSTMESAESDTDDAWCGSVSGGDEGIACICSKRCSAYDHDSDCGVCIVDYKNCEYKAPNVVINIIKPDSWYSGGNAEIAFTVSDVADTGNFELAYVRAKIGQNGSWIDVTEDRRLGISENCTVYVQVIDQYGNTYEKNRYIKCFDTTRPAINAAVSDGLLTVQVSDMESGAKAVYVNGYEFTEMTDGVLNIRLQQFDAGYEYFTIYAMDNSGNMSELYKTKNPYYKSGENENDDDPAKQLPASAEATKPGNASAVVTDHIKTDSNGNTVLQSPMQEEGVESEKSHSEYGREFYTIQTASEKVFYLIVDREGEEEVVYFLTEITENDLLNVTTGNSEILPKNSAAVESAIPIDESALPINNKDSVEGIEQKEENNTNLDNVGDEAKKDDLSDLEKETVGGGDESVTGYLFIGCLAVAIVGGAYYFKIVRKRKESFVEDEDDEELENDEYEDEWEKPENSSDDDFFDEVQE